MHRKMRKGRFPPYGSSTPSKPYSFSMFSFWLKVRNNENAQKDAQESISPVGVPNSGVAAQLLSKTYSLLMFSFWRKVRKNETSFGPCLRAVSCRAVSCRVFFRVVFVRVVSWHLFFVSSFCYRFVM